MDWSSIFNAFREYLWPHWPFIVVSFVLGLIGQVCKVRIWTKARAKTGTGWWWARATLPLHAPFAGAAAGVLFWKFLGSDAPAGPGVSGAGDLAFYYCGAGVVSSWLVNATKYFARMRGIDIPVELTEGESTPPPPEKP